jgi:hypothetical protein
MSVLTDLLAHARREHGGLILPDVVKRGLLCASARIRGVRGRRPFFRLLEVGQRPVAALSSIATI